MSTKTENSELKKKQEDAIERAAPSGKVVHDAILREGLEEIARPSAALFWSGLAAGLSMGFSFVAEALLQAHLPDAKWAQLITKLGYAVGFIIVVLGRQQLFTENTLTAVLPVLHNRNAKVLRNMFRLWGIVLLANLIGALAFGWATQTSAFDSHTREIFITLGREKFQYGFVATFWRAVFAGWLIALMVWLLPFAETARVGVVAVITYLVGLGHFGHIIAGAVDVFSLAWAGGISCASVITQFIIPVLIGNIVGGITMVTALNYGQVVGGKD